MNSVRLANILQNFVTSQEDLFGSQSKFVSLERSGTPERTMAFCSNSIFGRITYEKDNTQHTSEPFFFKITHDEYRIPHLDLYPFTNEAFFYSRLLPFYSNLRDLTHLFPKQYFAHMEICTGPIYSTIIFEDVQMKGYEHAKKYSILDYNHLTLLMRKLGEFHSYSYQAKKVNPRQFLQLSKSFVNTEWMCHYENLYPVCMRGFQPLTNDIKYANITSRLLKLFMFYDKFLIQWWKKYEDNSISVLGHGDYLRNNVLFRYENGNPVDMKMVDMASCRLCSPAFDILHILYLHADQQTRTSRWDDLIDEYYTALKYTFPNNDVPTRDDICDELLKNAPVTYYYVSFFLPSLIAQDHDMKSVVDHIPEKYLGMRHVPNEVVQAATMKTAGEIGTEAVAAALRDMIDRGCFVE